jgi:hypothetical protein
LLKLNPVLPLPNMLPPDPDEFAVPDVPNNDPPDAPVEAPVWKLKGFDMVALRGAEEDVVTQAPSGGEIKRENGQEMGGVIAEWRV